MRSTYIINNIIMSKERYMYLLHVHVYSRPQKKLTFRLRRTIIVRNDRLRIFLRLNDMQSRLTASSLSYSFSFYSFLTYCLVMIFNDSRILTRVVWTSFEHRLNDCLTYKPSFYKDETLTFFWPTVCIHNMFCVAMCIYMYMCMMTSKELTGTQCIIIHVHVQKCTPTCTCTCITCNLF